MEGRNNPAAGILDLGLSPEEKIQTMLEAAITISDNLVNIEYRDLNSPVYVSSMELLIFALEEFAERAEQDKHALDSRRAALLDCAWSIYNLLYHKHLWFVAHDEVQAAAHLLHALLEDYVIEAHQIIFEVNDANFKEKRTSDAHLKIQNEEIMDYLNALSAKLAELHEINFNENPDKTEDLKHICKAEMAALKAAQILMGFYLEHHEFDSLNGNGRRIAQVENVYNLFQELYEQRFLNSTHQAQALAFLELLNSYLLESTVEFNIIMLAHKKPEADASDDESLTSSLDDNHYLHVSNEMVVRLIPDDESSDEESFEFDPDTARWMESANHEYSYNPELVPLLSDVSEDESDDDLSCMPTRKIYEKNAAIMFQPQHRAASRLPVLPDPSDDELYGNNGIFTL